MNNKPWCNNKYLWLALIIINTKMIFVDIARGETMTIGIISIAALIICINQYITCLINRSV